MDKCFQIGDFTFRLIMPEEIMPPPDFMLFERENVQPQYCYTIRIGEVFPVLSGEVTATRNDLIVYRDGELESRLIGVKGRAGYYARYQELTASEAVVILDQNRLSSLHIDPVFSSLLALERRQIGLDALILHCAYVEYEGEAILFSAPSETGKTTQANLWEKYKNARTVNGDRALLQKKDGRWVARGWPVCGSSEVCNNEDLPIRSIVMLSQGKTDLVTALSPIQAFSQVYSQITVNRWDRAASNHAMDLIEQLVTDIEVWHLSCTISEEAVQCLHQILFFTQEATNEAR